MNVELFAAKQHLDSLFSLCLHLLSVLPFLLFQLNENIEEIIRFTWFTIFMYIYLLDILALVYFHELKRKKKHVYKNR